MTSGDSTASSRPDDGAMSFLDGNVLAGPLAGVFAVDVTVTVLTCAGCARRNRLATLRVYDAGLGLVARCPGCDHVVLRYATTPEGQWLDLGGTVSLQVPNGAYSPTGSSGWDASDAEASDAPDTGESATAPDRYGRTD